MIWGRLSYVLRETGASFRRNVTLTAAAIITSAIALLIFGLTLLIQRGFDNALVQWEGGVEMIVAVQADATDDQREEIRSAISDQGALIDSFEYCDVECSMTIAERLFVNDQLMLSTLTAATIPTQFRIVPADGLDGDQVQALEESLGDLPGVQNVLAPTDAIELLSKLKGFVGLYTTVIALALLVAAVLLIWNTIRTAMFARRREIEVMKLVGATDWFIRVPFMLEGLIQGLIGSLVACAGIGVINNRWDSGVQDFPGDASGGFKAMVVDSAFMYQRMGIILLIGMAAGAIGAGMAASRFLDV